MQRVWTYAVLVTASSLVTGCGLLGDGLTPVASPSRSSAVTRTSPAPDGTASSSAVPTPDSSGSAGPSAGPSARASASASTDPVAAQRIAAGLGATLVDAETAKLTTADGAIGFAHPDGKIDCGIYPPNHLAPAARAYVRCSIARPFTYTPPARPATCTGDWGGAIVLDAGRAGTFVCASDTENTAPALPVGKAVVLGDLLCASRADGITCRTVSAPGHGFQVSRQRYRLF